MPIDDTKPNKETQRFLDFFLHPPPPQVIPLIALNVSNVARSPLEINK